MVGQKVILRHFKPGRLTFFTGLCMTEGLLKKGVHTAGVILLHLNLRERPDLLGGTPQFQPESGFFNILLRCLLDDRNGLGAHVLTQVAETGKGAHVRTIRETLHGIRQNLSGTVCLKGLF